VQLSLRFLETPAPALELWEQLNEGERAEVVRILARLIAQAAFPELREETDDE